MPPSILAPETHAVDDAADILRYRDLVHLDLAGQRVDGDLRDVHGMEIHVAKWLGDVVGAPPGLLFGS